MSLLTAIQYVTGYRGRGIPSDRVSHQGPRLKWPDGRFHAQSALRGTQYRDLRDQAWEVVGAVADRNGLLKADVLFSGNVLQQFSLPVSVHHLPDNFSRELPILDFQLVGIYIVYVQLFLQIEAEIGEPA